MTNKNKVPVKKKKIRTEEERKKSAFRSTKAWKDFKRLVKLNHKDTCQICGIKKKGSTMHVHHCDPEHYEDLSKKFYLLCNACHRSIIERLLSRTNNQIDIDEVCENIKKVYNDSSDYAYRNKKK